MRFEGTLVTWNADRGVGTVLADQGGSELPVHVSAFPRDGRVPAVGELLSFELEVDRNARKCAVRISRIRPPQPAPLAFQKHAANKTPSASQHLSSAPNSVSYRAMAIVVMAAIAVGVYSYSEYNARQAPVQSVPQPVLATQTIPISARFQCDGRKHCSQMTSCSEAKLVLKNCPGTEMDGDGDGIPCEQQWCSGG